MNVVMVGHSSAGKTTYMALMYATMNDGIYGFQVQAKDPTHHQRLREAADAILRNAYPPPSDQRYEYDLQLRHAQTDLYDFRWRDYRGGSLTERSTSKQALELRADLAGADAIVIFTDAYELLTDARAHRKIRSVMAPVTEVMSSRQTLTPLVIALTKYDLLKPNTDPRPFRLAFEPLINAVAQSQHVIGSLIPVSCGSQPQNVVYPVLWCLYWGIAARGAELRAESDGRLALANAARGADTIWNRVSARLTGQMSNREIGALFMLSAYEQYLKLLPLIEPSQKLKEMLTEVPRF